MNTSTSPSLPALRMSILLALGLGGLAACGKDKGGSPDDSWTLGDDSGSTTSPACVGSEPVLLEDGSSSGYERCADGAIHRVTPVAVDPTVSDTRCEGTETWRDCETDDECTARDNGACLSFPDLWGEGPSCSCVYSCATDSDCSSGYVCVPPGVVETGTTYSVCAPASCTEDSDCADGECGLSSWDDGCGWNVQLQCRDPRDVCRSDDECADGQGCVPGYSPKAYTCRGSECDIGRPLLVEGQSRTAPTARRSDWSAELSPALPLDADERQALARRWASIAALEHASVASFARFTLQLMALGAPPELLAQTQRAAADEIEHARLAYGLASAYAGEPLGPGALSLVGTNPAFDPASVVRSLVAEACVGETVGVAEARARLDQTRDPVVRQVLQTISEDEERHAILAWRALAWLIPAFGEVAMAAAQEGLREGRAQVLRHGGDQDFRLQVLEQVVAPAFAAILAAQAATPSQGVEAHS